MFKKDFQGGSHIEVFSAQGRDPLAHWKLTGSVNREYLKDVRGYVVAMEGGSSTTNTRMQLPKTDKGSLALVQPYLVFQFMVPDGARLAIDLSVVDTGGSRRRIQMSTSQREVAATPLNARVPLVDILTGQWVNLCFDLDSLVSGLFKGQSFKSLEGVAVGGSCLIRRLFTLRSPPPDTTTESTATVGPPAVEIPRVCQMPTGGLTVQTQVMSYTSLSSSAHNRQTCTTSTVSSSSSAENLTTEERPTHIAFGKKVAIPNHILTSKQSSRSAMLSRQSSADSIRKVKEKDSEVASLDGQSLQPRPPSKPADPTILRVQKKRVRMISGGKQRTSAVSQNPGGGSSSTAVDSGFQTGTSDATSNLSEITISKSVSHIHTGTNTPLNKEQTQMALSSVESRLSHDEHMALDALKHKDQTETLNDAENQADNDNQLIGAGLDMSAVSDDYLNSTGDSQMLNTSVTSSVTRQSELDSSVDEVLYLYRSLPKSAERKQIDISKESLEGGRSAGLDEDFVSPVRENKPKISIHFAPPVAEVRPRSKELGVSQHESPSKNEESGVADQLNETRLSDDYDWRQYASVDGTDLTQSELSLRTRLANAPSSQQGTPRALNLVPLTSDSGMDGTLSGSVTHSGWTERFKDAAINPIHDSLDTRDMGGMLSPLMGTLTDEPDFVVDPAKGTTEGEELELMYDPQLNCFYDPNTGKYYELAQ